MAVGPRDIRIFRHTTNKGRSTSFLKKRSKKLLTIAAGVRLNQSTRMLPVMDKSFLVHFFKKEHTSFESFLPANPAPNSGNSPK
jgi:hypothetical protein